MAYLYFLGGIPRDISQEDLENYISNDLDVGCNVEYVWLDPNHERRAVFLSSERLDITKIQKLIERKELNDKILYLDEEKTTTYLYVEVPRMKCEALIDKLPWLFHQRNNGGSKVENIVEIKKGINFKLTFQNGWEAIMNVVKSHWFVHDTQVKVTPFFACFEENYKQQKERYKKHKEKELKQMDDNENTTHKTEPPKITLKAKDENISQHNTEPPKITPKAKDENISQHNTEPPKITPKAKDENISQHNTEPPKITLKAKDENISQHNTEPPKITLKAKDESISQPVKQKKFKTRKIFLDSTQCVLYSCLSLPMKTQELCPNVVLAVNMQDGSISMKGPEPLLCRLESMILHQFSLIHDGWRDEFDLFFNISNHNHLQEHFLNQEISVKLEENKDGNFELFILRDQKKVSLLEFLNSGMDVVQQFTNIKTTAEKATELISEFNASHFEYKIQAGSDRNSFKLLHFGLSKDYRQNTIILQEINCKIKTDQAELKGNASKSVEMRTDNSQSNRPAISPKPKIENIVIKWQLLDLLSCLEFEKKIQENCKVTARIDIQTNKISLRGQPATVDKLKILLFSVCEVFTSHLASLKKIEQLLATGKHLELLMTNFELRLETVEEKFVIYIEDKHGMKGEFKNFMTKVMTQVDAFSLLEATVKRDDQEAFLENFNSKYTDFRLIEINNDWFLLKLSYDRSHEITKEVEHFLFSPRSVEKEESSHSKVEGSDDEDEVFEDAKDNVDENIGKNQLAKQKRDSWGNAQGVQRFDLSRTQAHFLEFSTLSEMKKKLNLREVLDIKIEGKMLYITHSSSVNFSEMFYAVQIYLQQIKSETINLTFPALEEFYHSGNGLRLFSSIGKKHSCVIWIPDDSHSDNGQSSGNQEEVVFKVTVLETTTINNVHFHVAQGDGRNVQKDGSLHISLADPVSHCDGNITAAKQASVFLPPQRPRNSTEMLNDRIETSLRQLMLFGLQCLSISINSQCSKVYPSDMLARAIIQQVLKVFQLSNEQVEIFLCEAKSLPLLKAFQYTLKRTTVMNCPDDYLWRLSSNKVSSSRNSKLDTYPDDIKIEIVSSPEDKNNALVCYPVLSALDGNGYFFKHAKHLLKRHWSQADVINELERTFPDGLAVGEVHVFNKSPLQSGDLALYGCQEWGYNVKMAIECTLENCINKGIDYCAKIDKKDKQDSALSIVVPGAGDPFYPKDWLASKWFQTMDAIVKKTKTDHRKKFPGTIYFVVHNHQYNSLFAEFLKRRSQGTWTKRFKGKTPKGSSSAKGVDFTITTCGDPVPKNVRKDLQDELNKIMQQNEKTIDISYMKHCELKSTFESNNKIKFLYKKRGKNFIWTFSSLFKESVDESLRQLYPPLLAQSSSVDAPEKKGKKKKKTEKEMKNYTQQNYNMPKEIQGNRRGSENHDQQDRFVNIGDNGLEILREQEQLQNRENEGKVTTESLDEEEMFNTKETNGNKRHLKNDDWHQQSKESRGKDTSVKTVTDAVISEEASVKYKYANVTSDETSAKTVAGDVTMEETSVKTVDGDVRGDETSVKAIADDGKEDSNDRKAQNFLSPIDEYQWFYHDRNGTFAEFGDVDCIEIETAYRMKKPRCDLPSLNFSIDFSTMKARCRRDPLREFDLSRCEVLSVRTHAPPDYWTKEESISVVKKSEKDHKEIYEAIDDDLIIRRVDRIQIRDLFNKYKSKMSKIKGYSNEKVMWQRIDENAKEILKTTGCQKSLFRLTCDELGDGIPFALNTKSCVTKDDFEKKKPFTLVRCLVCLGHEGQGEGQPGLRYPPMDKSMNVPFYSVTNEEFCMVFSFAQAYPTHFIKVEAEGD